MNCSHKQKKEKKDSPTVVSLQNAKQIASYNCIDREQLSNCLNVTNMYLPDNFSSIFIPPIPADNDDGLAPFPWEQEAIESITNSAVPPPPPPPFCFDDTAESAEFNTRLIVESNYDLPKLLTNHQHTTLAYGSEFCPLLDLSTIYGQHKLFTFFLSLRQNIMEYLLHRELTEDEQMVEIAANLDQGNHRSATSQLMTLLEKLYRDVKYCFKVPVLTKIIKLISKSMMHPCGIAWQFNLKSTCKRVLKDRLTHYMMWAMTSPDASMNKSCNMDQYHPMIYRWCLSRTLQHIVALRNNCPDTKILISNYEFRNAYCRIVHAALAVV